VYGSLGGDDVPLVPARPSSSAPAPNANAEVRRDYELALQIGTREVWTAFLAQYQEGLYATLAKGQLNKIASEEARVAATEKARLAEEEKARLRAEGAKQAEQAKAAAEAKAAEDARIAAEKAKQAQLEKVAAAEQARAASEKLAADKLAAQKAVAEKLAREKAEAAMAAAAAKATSEKVLAEKPGAEAAKPDLQVASLPPIESSPPRAAMSGADIARLMQVELRRVGCLKEAADGEWASSSRRALELFNRNAGTKFDVKVASLDALDAIKAKPSRICPPVCEQGFKADGERCTKITCRPGYEVGDDDTCQKIEMKKPTARRDEPKIQREKPERIEAAPSKPQASGQILCNNQGCRPVAKGCRSGVPSYAGGGFAGRDVEVCN
jgi:hypothetical protein